MPYENEERYGLKEAMEECFKDGAYEGEISVVTGPEGGFEENEVEYAMQAGLKAVTLGSRILRCETAPAAVLAAMMYHTGNLG